MNRCTSVHAYVVATSDSAAVCPGCCLAPSLQGRSSSGPSGKLHALRHSSDSLQTDSLQSDSLRLVRAAVQLAVQLAMSVVLPGAVGLQGATHAQTSASGPMSLQLLQLAPSLGQQPASLLLLLLLSRTLLAVLLSVSKLLAMLSQLPLLGRLHVCADPAAAAAAAAPGA